MILILSCLIHHPLKSRQAAVITTAWTNLYNPLTQHGFQRLINDESIPDDDEQQEQKESIIDPYINMEVGLSCGDDFDLHHARV